LATPHRMPNYYRLSILYQIVLVVWDYLTNIFLVENFVSPPRAVALRPCRLPLTVLTRCLAT